MWSSESAAAGAAEPVVAAAAEAWLRRGDQGAAAALHRHMLPLLRAVVAGFPTLRSESDDVLQQISIRAFAALPRFDLRRPLAPWLRVLARRCCLDRQHAARRQPSTPAAGAALPEESDPAPTPDARLLALERLGELRLSFARLPAADRAVLELQGEGLTPAAAAARLGCAPGALRVRTHRARARLRELLLRAAAEATLPLAA